MSPGSLSPQSPSDVFLHSQSLEEKQTSVSAYPKQKTSSLPGEYTICFIQNRFS